MEPEQSAEQVEQEEQVLLVVQVVAWVALVAPVEHLTSEGSLGTTREPPFSLHITQWVPLAELAEQGEQVAPVVMPVHRGLAPTLQPQPEPTPLPVERAVP